MSLLMGGISREQGVLYLCVNAAHPDDDVRYLYKRVIAFCLAWEGGREHACVS